MVTKISWIFESVYLAQENGGALTNTQQNRDCQLFNTTGRFNSDIRHL